jgi:CO/xanthine dehydrogenase FAD-binding subunit
MITNVISPETTEELLASIDENLDKEFRFGAGYTDLLVELRKQPNHGLTIINLAYLEDDKFTSISKSESGIRIGALVTAKEIVSKKELQIEFPVLYEAANKLASGQIRQVATVGGNLCTASPAGDIACALVALEAQCEIISSKGKVRTIPCSSFFVDVRKTDLKKDEILRSIFIHSRNEKTYSAFIKIGTRRSMECSVVSLAYHFYLDSDGKIVQAGIAIGSVAPTIMFVHSACDFLIGKKLSSISKSEIEEFAKKVLENARPISDIRASAWYRKEVLYNICKSLFDQF